MSSRTTRSRSRGRLQVDDSTVPAASFAALSVSKSFSGNGLNGHASNGHVTHAAPQTQSVVVEESKESPTNYSQRILAGAGQYYWCSGEPTLGKVAAHLDTLTANDLELRAKSNTLRNDVTALNSTVSSLLDMDARLKRELRAQKLSANRRWFFAGVLFLAYILGGSGAIRTVTDTLIWATHSPAEFFPALLDSIQVMTSWSAVFAFPLALFLFIHKILNGYGRGFFSLTRTILFLAVGIVMEVPLLYFLMQTALVGLANLKANPLFSTQHNQWNHVVTISVWLFTLLVDYTLLILHQYL